MATDYDAPRKTDEEMSEDSLEELQGRVKTATGGVDEDETETLPDRVIRSVRFRFLTWGAIPAA